MSLLLKTLFVAGYGWLSRMCGGAPPKLSHGLDQHLYALPYAILVCTLLSTLGLPLLTVAAATVVTYIGAYLGKRTSHGGGIDDGRSPKEPGAGRDKERLEFLIFWLFDKIDRKLYDFLLLTITGLAVTIVPAVVCIYFGFIFTGVVLLLTGASKGVAYQIGWALRDYEHKRGHTYFNGEAEIMTRYPKYLNEPTAIGEALTGVFGGFGIVATT